MLQRNLGRKNGLSWTNRSRPGGKRCGALRDMRDQKATALRGTAQYRNRRMIAFFCQPHSTARSVCSAACPTIGMSTILDRCSSRSEPNVLIAQDGYGTAGKTVDRREILRLEGAAAQSGLQLVVNGAVRGRSAPKAYVVEQPARDRDAHI